MVDAPRAEPPLRDLEAAALAERLSAQRAITIDYRTVPEANHFFNEHIDSLIAHVDDYLDTHLPPDLTAEQI